MTDDEKLANRVANDLVARKAAGVVAIVVPAERVAPLRIVMDARWKAMLSAYSSGIAHADQDVDTGPAEATLAQLKKIEILVVSDASQLPAGSTIVDVSDAPARAY